MKNQKEEKDMSQFLDSVITRALNSMEQETEGCEDSQPCSMPDSLVMSFGGEACDTKAPEEAPDNSIKKIKAWKRNK